MQLALDLPIPAVPERRTAMKVATRRGDQAIAAGAEKAKRIDPAFLERAEAHMVSYLREHGTSSGELLVDACKLAGIRPSNDKHFGHVLRTLQKPGGPIRWAGECRRTKGHATRGGSLYELVR